MDWHPIQGGVEILLVATCYTRRPDGPFSSYADFTVNLFYADRSVLFALRKTKMNILYNSFLTLYSGCFDNGILRQCEISQLNKRQ